MERLLIFIKHHHSLLWEIIEWSNGFIFFLLYRSRMEKVFPVVIDESAKPPFSYRKLELSDSDSLHDLIKRQKVTDLEYFSPHGFDITSIIKQFKNPAFLMLGVFKAENIVGYFFLRFFANRKCFVGRLIDKEYRGQGIGYVMNRIMYETSWRMNFRCLSTISRNNISVMNAHKKNQSMVILKELQNDYILVEFIRVDYVGE
jgi:hypothetical protein